MVLVSVGEDQGLDPVEAVPDGLEVGEDQVDARVVLLREEDAAVHDEQPALVLEDGHVAADLAQPAQRDDAHGAVGERAGRGELGMWMAHTGSTPNSSRTSRISATSSSEAGTSGSRIARSPITPISCIAALAAMAPCARCMITSMTGTSLS